VVSILRALDGGGGVVIAGGLPPASRGIVGPGGAHWTFVLHRVLISHRQGYGNLLLDFGTLSCI